MLIKMIKIIPSSKEKVKSLLRVLTEIDKTNKDFILLLKMNFKTNFKLKLDNDNNDINDNHPHHRRDKSYN